MSMLNSLTSPFSLIFALLVVSINVTQAKFCTPLFVFGDSFYDTGNSVYLGTTTMRANVPPYGESYFKKPTGRFSDGRLIPDFIAQDAYLPFLPPYLQPGLTSYEKGVVFACAGAGALNETFPGRVISLHMQIENYKKVIVNLRQQFGYGYSKAILSKAVYMFNIGINDYIYPYATNPAIIDLQYINSVVGNITMAIKEIYRLGGRKFTINNVGPLGCFPIVKAPLDYYGSCVAPVSEPVLIHNLQLKQALAGLATQYTDFKYGLFDMYTNLEKRIKFPTSYGFKESTSCCGTGPSRGIFSCGGQGNITKYELCPNPKEYVFWDSVHPSEMTYNILSSLIWAGSSSDIGPYNIKTLFNLS